MATFVDQVTLHLRAGHGGNGCVSVKREKFKPLAGPYGGNGGNGGDIILVADPQGTTLLGYLEEIQREHGLFVASQFNATLPGTSGAAQIKAVMANFRSKPIASIGACSISAAKDYESGTLPLPKSNVLAWERKGGHRVPGHRAQHDGAGG